MTMRVGILFRDSSALDSVTQRKTDPLCMWVLLTYFFEFVGMQILDTCATGSDNGGRGFYRLSMQEWFCQVALRKKSSPSIPHQCLSRLWQQL